MVSPVELPVGGGGGGGGGEVGGAVSYDREKAWSSINHSILYGLGGGGEERELGIKVQKHDKYRMHKSDC